MRMPFGQYKGQPLSTIPDEYLEWLTTIELREPLASAVYAEIAARRDPSKPDLMLAKAIINLGYRKLATEKHPDVGGTEDEMKSLNSTADWLRRQVEALTC